MFPHCSSQAVKREQHARRHHRARLGDLKPWHVLKVRCLQCRHESIVSPAPLLVRRFGENAFLNRIEDLFRCTECDHRGGKLR